MVWKWTSGDKKTGAVKESRQGVNLGVNLGVELLNGYDYSDEYAEELLKRVRKVYGVVLRSLADSVQQ